MLAVLGFESLMNWLAGLGQLIYCTLVRWICWFLQFFFDMAITLIQSVIPTLNMPNGGFLGYVTDWTSAVNTWLPLDGSDGIFAVWAIWFSWASVLMVYRLVRMAWPF